jgi:hypothetical protein
MVAATRTRTRTTTTAPANATTADRGRRVSLGTAFMTKNDSFYAGGIEPSNGTYANQTELLGLLGPAPEGFHWRLKVWVVDYEKNGVQKTRLDVAAELEPIQAR